MRRKIKRQGKANRRLQARVNDLKKQVDFERGKYGDLLKKHYQLVQASREVSGSWSKLKKILKKIFKGV